MVRRSPGSLKKGGADKRYNYCPYCGHSLKEMDSQATRRREWPIGMCVEKSAQILKCSNTLCERLWSQATTLTNITNTDKFILKDKGE